MYPEYLPQGRSILYGYPDDGGSRQSLQERRKSESWSKKKTRTVWTVIAIVFMIAIGVGAGIVIFLTSQSKYCCPRVELEKSLTYFTKYVDLTGTRVCDEERLVYCVLFCSVFSSHFSIRIF